MEKVDNNTIEAGGVISTTFVILLVLKLCKAITWSWAWVFSPFWITICVVMIALWIGIFIRIIKECVK